MLFKYFLEKLFQATIVDAIPQRSRTLSNSVQLEIPLLYSLQNSGAKYVGNKMQMRF